MYMQERFCCCFAFLAVKTNVDSSLTLVLLNRIYPAFANSVDLDQLASEEVGLGGSVGCTARLETRRSRVQHRRGWQHSFVEIDHEIFSTVILSHPLIQEGQLSVSGERMCTILVNCLEN